MKWPSEIRNWCSEATRTEQLWGPASDQWVHWTFCCLSKKAVKVTTCGLKPSHLSCCSKPVWAPGGHSHLDRWSRSQRSCQEACRPHRTTRRWLEGEATKISYSSDWTSFWLYLFYRRGWVLLRCVWACLDSLISFHCLSRLWTCWRLKVFSCTYQAAPLQLRNDTTSQADSSRARHVRCRSSVVQQQIRHLSKQTKIQISENGTRWGSPPQKEAQGLISNRGSEAAHLHQSLKPRLWITAKLGSSANASLAVASHIDLGEWRSWFRPTQAVLHIWALFLRCRAQWWSRTPRRSPVPLGFYPNVASGWAWPVPVCWPPSPLTAGTGSSSLIMDAGLISGCFRVSLKVTPELGLIAQGHHSGWWGMVNQRPQSKH